MENNSLKTVLTVCITGILLGTILIPAINSEVNDKTLPVKVSTFNKEIKEKSLSFTTINEIKSLLNTLQNNPEKYEIYLPIILRKLDDLGLIKDAIETEQSMMRNIKNPITFTPNDNFLNVFCFMTGNSTNSVLLTISSSAIILFFNTLFWFTRFIPILNLIFPIIFEIIFYSMIYPPRIIFPVGFWHIGWEGEISTYGLLGYQNRTIHGGKFGKRCYVFGFKGLWLTLPMGEGFTENWFMGTARAITEL